MKPIEIKYKYGLVIALIILVFALLAFFEKGIKFYRLIAPDGTLLNWRFVLIIVVITSTIVWFIMNHLWKKEFENHQKTRYERDNYAELLKISENERLTDIITGVPNLQSLKKDIDVHFSKRKHKKKLQFILIDLKGFKKINNKYGFLKANELLRTIAQTIYQKMRRNEDMYKYPMDIKNEKNEHFYRIHTGGDEFVFIIQGNQTDALGFANRLVKNDFSKLSSLTKEILGESIKLSFHCAVVEMDPRDEVEDILRKSDECYILAKEAKGDFSICWHPITIEEKLNKKWELAIYEETRELFDVMTINETDYE